ncbi:putative phage abortive infection protein [Bacillus cereus]|nr:putative phage abortive infection protein [Bacillus cereus]
MTIINIENNENNENNENKNTEGWAKFFTWIGFALVPIAMAMPFIVYHYDLSYLKEFGAVGDFIGGTTVTFLTGASVFLLIATNIMQRKELQMSRKSIDEMVKQTKASVKQMKASVQQAEEAKKETQITNETMKRQQFETTFFNMINLHHNILKEIRYNDKVGREAIPEFYEELEKKYDGTIYLRYRTQFLNNIINSGNIDELNDFAKQVLIYKKLWSFKQSHGFHFRENMGEDLDRAWNQEEAKIIQDFEENVKNNRKKCGEILELFDFKWHIENESNINHEYINKFKMNYYNESLREIKQDAYETLYKRHENLIGHYYRNLYRIVKLIQKNNFDSESQERDNEEKRQYRGILRAQLSSFELLMLFYNISYSEKGKKFKELVAGINFFDDHLIKEDFIWKNDVTELANLNKYKYKIETNSFYD